MEPQHKEAQVGVTLVIMEPLEVDQALLVLLEVDQAILGRVTIQDMHLQANSEHPQILVPKVVPLSLLELLCAAINLSLGPASATLTAPRKATAALITQIIVEC